MRAIAITRPGGPEVLAVVERPRPEPSRGEVRVRVRATAVHRADLLQRMGGYPAPAAAPPDIPGLEIAGEVEALGPGVTRLAAGDRVFGLVGGGGYAEAIVAHERALARIPDGLSFEQAAAIPEAFITAHDAIITQAGLKSGETLLVSAAGSGVGTAAIQLAHALGAFVEGTARTGSANRPPSATTPASMPSAFAFSSLSAVRAVPITYAPTARPS
jgi:NADPH:quinone reductase-like Zn-dependent oxidoreductase